MTKTIAVFKRKGPWGGGPIYTQILTNGLKKLGYRVILITDSQSFIKRIIADQKIYINHLNNIPDKRNEIIKFILFWPVELIKYIATLNKIKKSGCSTLILQDLNEKILVTPLAYLFKIKVFWVEHTSWEPHLVGHPLFFLVKFSGRYVEKIITPSKFVGYQINKIKSLSNKVVIINHGVPQKVLKATNKKPRLVVISRLSYEKGVDVLIKALNNVKIKTEVIIIGAGPQEIELKKLINNLKINHKIQFLSDKIDPYKYISPKDILILPSRAENFPLVLLEALSAGLPVIASDVGGTSEIIINDENGHLFNNGNAKDLASQINKLLKNPQKISAIQKNNLKRYSTCFTDTMMVSKTTKIV